MTTTPIRALCVDYFDTLVNDRLGLPRLGDLLGLPDEFEEVWLEWGEARMTTSIGFETLLHEVFRRAGKQLDQELIAAVSAERSTRRRRLLREPNDRVRSMLAECRRHGLRIAVVSNAACDDLEAWSGSWLAPLVDVTVFSFEVGATKPDCAIYEAALRRLDVSANETAFLDDATSCLRGARAVGVTRLLRAAWFLDRHEHTSDPSDSSIEIVATPEDVPTLLFP